MSKVQFDFSGENFIVTGASSGIGRQAAIELAEAGAKVLGIARGVEALNMLHEQYPNIIPASLDVCDSAAMETAIHAFVAEHGKIKGAVHAAGITGLTPLRAYDENEAKKIMETSFFAGTKLLQFCSKRNVSVDGASFVLFSSAGALRPAKGMFAYACAKMAVQTMTHCFAKEICNRKLRINSISPGWVLTNMTKGLEDVYNLSDINNDSLLGIGKPEDVSGTIMFLLSDRANWITGTNVVVDGGYLA